MQLKEYRGADLGLKPEAISSAALRTCDTLQQGGHKAFVVGGGVRDLLLGLKPKDFDVATSATPEQVQALFRRARIIGRRFKIVHVVFGREVIEVSTFRAVQADAETDEHGRVLRDNVYGSQEEDALRRDFTINALYYDPSSDRVHDYVDGVRDMQQRVLRMIGDPLVRYREDPVRMLRTVRFAAKLGFSVDEATREPIRELAPLIENVPAARLFDEMLKLLLSGHAGECVTWLRREGLHHGLLPLLDVILEQPAGERFVEVALARTDERVRDGKPVSPGFLFATLLWEQVRHRWLQRRGVGEYPMPALMSSIDSVLDEQSEKLAIQRRYQSDMREIWSMQPRLEKVGRNALRTIEHLRFRAAYDFMLLRCEAGELPAELGEWWTRFIEADPAGREQMLSARPAEPRSGGAKRRRRRGGARDDATAAPPAGAPEPGDGSESRDKIAVASTAPPASAAPAPPPS
ncbi:MAG TPA: polynucleotide adenylyltransferase PcnB [Burkholderiaceae bacterium]|nr:polynucleotide adenylyltransferase PcnB [Burkholderiaceae bacterium]